MYEIIARILFNPVSVAVLVFLGMAAYDRLIDDPAVTEKARQDYVSKVEVESLEAQLIAQKRQARIAQDAASRFQTERDTLDAQLAEQLKIDDEKIKSYIRQSLEQGKSRPYTVDDFNFMREQR
jgi:hypothetical protein